MASVRLTWRGLAELRAALQRLPDDLRNEAADHVEASASSAAAAIMAAYPRHSGNLRDHVTVKTLDAPTRYGIRKQVRSTAKHSHLFEYGTQIRRSSTRSNLGAMPAKPTVIPNVIRERRKLQGTLIGIVQRAGFTVRE